jgi:hypothetical protein
MMQPQQWMQQPRLTLRLIEIHGGFPRRRRSGKVAASFKLRIPHDR